MFLSLDFFSDAIKKLNKAAMFSVISRASFDDKGTSLYGSHI